MKGGKEGGHKESERQQGEHVEHNACVKGQHCPAKLVFSDKSMWLHIVI